MRPPVAITATLLVALLVASQQINGDLSSALDSVKDLRIVWKENKFNLDQFKNIDNNIKYPPRLGAKTTRAPSRSQVEVVRDTSDEDTAEGEADYSGESNRFYDAPDGSEPKFYDASDKSLEVSPSPSRWTFLGLISKFANLALSPTKNYINLVVRYGQFYRDFNQLKAELVDKKTGKPLIDASAFEMLRIVYAQVDEQLYREACEDLLDEQLGDGQPSGQEQLYENPTQMITKAQQKRLENVDFVLKVIRMTIEPLEAKLVSIRRAGRMSDEDLKSIERLRSESLEEDENVQKAMDRAKRIVLSSAKQVALVEMKALIKIAAMNAIAARMKSRERGDSGVADPLAYLEPIFYLLGDPNTSFIVSHLKDMKFRAALGMLNQFNPLAVSCKKRPARKMLDELD